MLAEIPVGEVIVNIYLTKKQEQKLLIKKESKIPKCPENIQTGKVKVSNVNIAASSVKENDLNQAYEKKHNGLSGLNPISSFIFRNGLEEFSEEYIFYFNKFGFSREEEDHVEKMIGSYGAD